MVYKDYYKILGIDKSAATEEIKKAYRKLAQKYHPDRNPGDKSAEEKFKEINEAHAVLSDKEKRKKYDQFGQDWKHYQEAGMHEGGFDWSKYADRGGGRTYYYTSTGNVDEIFGGKGAQDFFEMLFGQRFGAEQARGPIMTKGQDLRADLVITLDEAYNGTSRAFQLNGQTLKINIKPGIQDQQVLKLSGKGGPGFDGGQKGDLYITVKVTHHPEFQRKGNDLYCDITVALYTSVLGGKVDVKTHKGNVKVNIPKQTENGKVLKLSGFGMPHYGSPNKFGDLFVKVHVEIPKNLSKKEVELFEQLAELRK